MDRFITKEPRVGEGFPQGNQMMAFPGNTRSDNIASSENLYYNGGYPGNFHNTEQPVVNMPQHMNLPHIGQIQPQNMYTPHIMSQIQLQNMSSHMGQTRPQNMNSPHVGQTGPQNMNSPHVGQTPQQNINLPHMGQTQQQNMISPHMQIQPPNMNTPHKGQTEPQNMIASHMGFGVTQTVSTGPTMVPQGHMSGIDPRYFAGYGDASAQYVGGQQIQRKPSSIYSFGNDYQNRNFDGADRNKPKNVQQSLSKPIPEVMSLGGLEPAKVEEMPKPQTYTAPEVKSTHKQNQQNSQSKFPSSKKPNELNLSKNDDQIHTMTRADKLKALHKTGPRAFSGPVEKVLKWHKTLQDVGILIIYEIVAKCVSVRPGEHCSKNLVVRDDSGPAIQVVYYEIDFLLPELKPPCTVRIIGRMMAGSCRFQAFNVRAATGDDVATLPRRAAVSAHHVAKLCKEYGLNG